MTEPKATDKVLGDIMTEMKILSQSVSDAAKRVGETLYTVNEIRQELAQIERRMMIVENKTHGLSTRPTPRNCNNPQCGRIMHGAQNRCGTCGKEQ